jgi:hypothetical protein
MRWLTAIGVGGLAALALGAGCSALIGLEEGLPKEDPKKDSGAEDICTPLAEQPCYTGPEGTVGKGICSEGVRTCSADGSGWGDCVGQVIPSLEDCATPEDDDCDGVAPLCNGAEIWSKRFGEARNQQAAGITVDEDGEITMIGSFSGDMDLGGGTMSSTGLELEDVFVARFGPAGQHRWSARFGDSATQLGQAIAVDKDGNTLITGTFWGTLDLGDGPLMNDAGGKDGFVAKLSPMGEVLWSKQIGGAGNVEIAALAVDPDGGVLVTGGFEGSIAFDGGGSLQSVGGSQDAFLARFSPEGPLDWTARLGDSTGSVDPADQTGRCLAVDGMGTILMGGEFGGTIDFGVDTLTSVGGSDIFGARFDQNTFYLGSVHYGGVGQDLLTSMVIAPAGDIVVTGAFEGSIDLGGGPLESVSYIDGFIARFSSGGGHRWSRAFGTMGFDVATNVAVADDGDVFMAGLVNGQVDLGGGPLDPGGGVDVVVARFGLAGEHRWSGLFGGPDDQYVSGIARGPDGIIVAGAFFGSLSFGRASLESQGGTDVFLAKLAP